ncbi:MAG TPA: hypothetical protein VFL98_02665 [Candidatus Paceibacterota bacterium]|nr:hypothetical protein [Candidatus Paceibacterota bacterium]
MARFEQLPADSPLAQHLEQEAGMLPIGDNRVQVALMHEWRPDLDRNDLALEWATGMAERFRAYAEANPGEEIDIRDASALRQALDAIGEETLH